MRWLYPVLLVSWSTPMSSVRPKPVAPPVVEEPAICVRSPLHALVPYAAPQAAARPRCFDPVVRLERGVARGTVCPDEARELGLTIVDLRDAWTPALFAGAGGVVPAFHARYLEIAAEHDAKGKPIDAAEALGELYGVVPSLAIVRERLS